MSTKKLSGKVAVITGGARGLGRGYALRLAGLGADIAIIDRNLKSADVYEFEKAEMTAPTVMEECKALDVKSMGIEVDLTDRDKTEAAIAEVVENLGRVDIAICNAGGGTIVFADERKDEKPDSGDINLQASTSKCPQETLTRVLEINLMTCMYTCMAVAPYMKAQRSGKIITASSISGIEATPYYHPYGTAKAAIIHYTRSLAQDLGRYNINVNSIAPGIIRTGRLGNREHLSKYIALNREGTIEECCGVIEFLATDLSDYVSGVTIAIDGGQIDHKLPLV